MDVDVGQASLQLRNLGRRDGKTIRIGPGSSGWKTSEIDDDRRIHSRGAWSMNVGHGRVPSDQTRKIKIYRHHCLRLV